MVLQVPSLRRFREVIHLCSPEMTQASCNEPCGPVNGYVAREIDEAGSILRLGSRTAALMISRGRTKRASSISTMQSMATRQGM